MSIEIFRLAYNKFGDNMKLSFGEKIKSLREDADLTQTQLGKAVNMTQRKISYIECGKYEPSIEDIIALCGFFKVSANYLLDIPKEYNHPDR